MEKYQNNGHTNALMETAVKRQSDSFGKGRHQVLWMILIESDETFG